jgi:hypothetical protein
VSQKGIVFFLTKRILALSEIFVQDFGNVNFNHLKMMVEEKHWNIRHINVVD